MNLKKRHFQNPNPKTTISDFLETILKNNIADIIFFVFIIISILSGYLSGGFREILKLCCLIISFFVFMLNSVEQAIFDVVGVTFYHFAKFIGFFLVYFLLYLVFKWLFHGVISIKEGVFGRMNRTFGIMAGILKSCFVILFFVSILNFMWSPRRAVLLEVKPYFQTSVVYRLADNILKAFGNS